MKKSLERSNELFEQYKNESPQKELVAEKKEEFSRDLLQAVTGDKGGNPEKNSALKDRITKNISYFGDEYAKADVLAGKYQKRYRLASKAIYSLSAFAVIVVSGQYIFHLPHLVGAFEILAMVIILLILNLGNKAGWHRRWKDYRFLAERIRYGIYIAIVVQKGSSDVEKTLAYRWLGDSWCLHYFQDLWEQRVRSAPVKEVKVDAIKNLIDTTWLSSQKKYHAGKKHKELKNHEKISKLSEVFFGLTLFAATLHLLPTILHLLHVNIHVPGEQIVNSVLTFFAIVFPTLAAACTGLRAHFDYKKLADRSAMMENNLGVLQKNLQYSSTYQEIQEVALEAESLMIQESSDWYVTVGLHELEAA